MDGMSIFHWMGPKSDITLALVRELWQIVLMLVYKPLAHNQTVDPTRTKIYKIRATLNHKRRLVFPGPVWSQGEDSRARTRYI